MTSMECRSTVGWYFFFQNLLDLGFGKVLLFLSLLLKDSMLVALVTKNMRQKTT